MTSPGGNQCKNRHVPIWQHSLVLFMKTRIGVMSCGTAGPLGSVPGMWNHLQGDQVN